MKKQTLLLLAVSLISLPTQFQAISIRRHITEAIEGVIVNEVAQEVRTNQIQPPRLPAPRIEVSQAVKERQKKVQALAKFIASKKTVRILSGSLNRSIKPLEKLLNRCFTSYDFHRHQLRDMESSIQELMALLKKHEPTVTESLFSMLSDPRFAAYMQQVSELDVKDPNWQSYIEMDQLTLLLDEFNAKLEGMDKDFEAWALKWETSIEEVGSYIAGRNNQYRQKDLEEASHEFMMSMIWQHIGPALSLMIKSSWHSRGIKNTGECGPQLLSATYTHAMQNQVVLKQEIHAEFARTLTAYEVMFQRVFSRAYARSPR